MKFAIKPQAPDHSPLLPPDFRSEAFAEDLLEAPATQGWQRDWSLLLVPLGLAMLGGALPWMQTPY